MVVSLSIYIYVYICIYIYIRTVDPEQFLRVDGVRLVEYHADLVVVPLERLDGVLELVRDVELVRVEEKKDDVCGRIIYKYRYK